MTTKERLNRAYELNKRITHNLEVIDNLRVAATNTTVDFSVERVQTSKPTGSQMSTFVEMAYDLEQIVNKQQEQLAKIKKEITDEINTIDDYETKLVLKLRYLDFFSWSRIAAMLVMSERSVFRLHKEGIEKLSVRVSS